MLSIENSPNPSSPNLSEVKIVDQVSQGACFEDAIDPAVNELIPTSKFSVRNYVYESRRRDIQVNWPFALPFLQNCLNHGVKDILPPFESPSLVRAQCFQEIQTEIDRSVVNLESVKTFEIVKLLKPDTASESRSSLDFNCVDPVIISSSFKDKKSTVEQGINIYRRVSTDKEIIIHEQAEEPLVQTNPSSGIVAENNRSLEKSGQPAEFEPVDPGGNLEEVKCRLIVKLGAIPDNIQGDDLASNTCSDTMASKVCPVCKTFTSTSNTTLNAHVDQCLSVKLDVNRDSISYRKLNVKQKKKRLMVDIYTTARRCTLEDLDRRNGTNWAVELTSFAAPASEVVTVGKKPKSMYLEPRDDTDDKEVYVDSNGIKLRILSKSAETPLLEEPERRNIKTEKKVNTKMMRKNKEFGPKCLKKMKTKVRTREMTSFEVSNSQIQTASEGDCGEENHQTSDESDDRMQVNSRGGSSLGHWVCAKRSNVPRKLASNNPAARNILTDSSKSDEYRSLSRINQKKASRTSKEMISPHKTKEVGFLCTRKDMNDRRNYPKTACASSDMPLETTIPPKRLVLKLSGLSGTSILSKGKLDVHERIAEESDRISSKSMRPSQDRTSSISMKELFVTKTWKDEVNGEPHCSKRFHEHGAHLTRKRICFGEQVNQEAQATQSPDSDIAARSRTVQPCQFGMSFSSAADQAMTQVLQIGRNKTKTNRRLLVNMSEDEEDNAECLPFEAETDNELDIQTPKNTAAEASPGLTTYEHISKTEAGEDMEINAYTALDACTSTEEQAASENNVGSFHILEQSPQSLDHKDALICVVSHEDIGCEDVEMADEAETSGARDNLDVQSSECHTNSSSIQEYSGCLTCHSNLDTEVPNRSSSIDSERNIKNHDQNLAKHEPTASAASTVCLSSSLDTNCINSEEQMTEARSLHYNAVSAAESPKKLGMTQEKNIETNIEVPDHLPVKDNSWLDDDKHFCCSCRENFSRGKQLSRTTDNAGTSQVKQMFPNLFIGPRTSSSFTAYQSRRTDDAISSKFGSQNQAIPTKNSFDSTVNNPNHTDMRFPGTPSKSNSNSVLRLMGKNLMVLNSGDLVQPQSNSMCYPSARNDVQTGFSAANNLPNNDHCPAHQHQLLHGHPALVHAVSMGSHEMPLYLPITSVDGFVEPKFPSDWMARTDYQTQPRHIYEGTIPSRAPYTTNGVILMGGSPKPVTEINGFLSSPTSTLPLFTSSSNPFPHRSFSYFPLQSQMRQVSSCEQPLYPNFHPSVPPTSQGIKSEGQGDHLPGQIVFQSPASGPMASSGYYSHTML